MSFKQAPVFRLLCRYPRQNAQSYCRRLNVRSASTTARQWSTPLAKNLAEAITTTGPIPIASYMRQCLTSPEGGYYTRLASDGGDQFGKTGDFITSPEISQIFGELVGIWFVAEWMGQGRKTSGVQFVELGPGRGTLMADILRTISNFKPMSSAVETIYLVEASASLREAQHKLLSGSAPLEAHALGYQSQSKHLPSATIVWIEDINLVPREPNKTPFIVAHEFFDALPIHAFQSATAPPRSDKNTKHSAGITTTISDPVNQHPHSKPQQNEWRELLVSPTAPPSILNPSSTPGPEFELALSPTPTHYSRLLPNLSPRYAALVHSTGSTIEISPEALTTTTALTHMVTGTSPKPPGSSQKRNPASNPNKPHPSGAVLIMDYGPSSTIPISTLRGIRNHTRRSPFESPGLVDLSADVDFGALVETSLAASEDIEVHGPAEQGDWLTAMGGRERCDALLRKAGDDNEIRERLETGWTRLVEKGTNGMGRLYKVLSIVPYTGGARRPVGFGGDIGH